MNNRNFMSIVIQSLEAITKPYRHPFEDVLYERILCYEFYHQFRLRVEDFCSFVLHGELEKGYRDIDYIPDFVFHVPSTDKENIAIMEFKSARYSSIVLTEDLRKLLRFKSDPLHYQLGIFVLFGDGSNLTNKFSELNKPDEADMELIAIAYDIQSGKVANTRTL